jgi:hypothetical protein
MKTRFIHDYFLSVFVSAPAKTGRSRAPVQAQGGEPAPMIDGALTILQQIDITAYFIYILTGAILLYI